MGKGTGIGLAVSHGIVEKHGGAISADGEPGKGTVITVWFPAYPGRCDQAVKENRELPGQTFLFFYGLFFELKFFFSFFPGIIEFLICV